MKIKALTLSLALSCMSLQLQAAMSGAFPQPGPADEYGLMVPVAGAEDYVRAEMQRRLLADNGVRVNLVRTTDGPRLMVWETDRDRALDVLSRGGV